MKLPKTIPRSSSLDTCTNYQALLRQGIQYVQELAGDLWTDYNKHDPGVTILEQLCYAITDLSYRTDFVIPDILAVAPSSAAPDHTLFTGDKILPCNPLTTNDYRKFLYDRIAGLKNAWLVPVTDHPLGVQGLYRVLVETREEIEAPADVEAIRKNVQQLMRATRNLGEDIEEVKILQPQPIQVEAIIEIAPHVDPVNILAQVLFNIQNSLIPFPQVQLIDELFRSQQPDNIWNGPLLTHGALEKRSLKELPSSIDVQEIANIMLQVRGVKRVKQLKAGTPPEPPGVKPIHIQEGHVPRLEPAILKPQESYSIKVELEGGVKWQVDAKAVWARIQELETGMRNSIAYADRSTLAMSYHQLPAGQYRNVEEYFSIQHQFPVVYGLSKYGIANGLLEGIQLASRVERQARVQQLKAYLLFFEQLLANYLSQLSHVADLFSLEENLHQSYFYQPLAHQPPRTSEPQKIVDVLVQSTAGSQRNLSRYLVCVVDIHGKIVFVTRRMPKLTQAQELRQQIIESGQHSHNYRANANSAGEVQLALHNAAGDFLAMGQERFPSVATARAAADRWTKFMIGLVDVKNLLEKLVKIYRREDLILQVLNDNSEIVLSSTAIQSQDERERRIAEIITCGMDRGNYFFRAMARGGFRISLRNLRTELIAEGEQRFDTEFDAEEGVDDLVMLLSRMAQDQAVRDRHIRTSPEVEEIRTPLRAYQENLAALMRQSDRHYLSRRNNILNHLLARFGERFDDAILERLDWRPFGEKDDFYRELIRWKIEFLRGYVDSGSGDTNASPVGESRAPAMGAERGLAFNYAAADGSNAVSGLERRLSLLLGLHGHAEGDKYHHAGKDNPQDFNCYYLEKRVSRLESKQVQDRSGQYLTQSQHRIDDLWREGDPDLNDLHHNFIFSSEDSGVMRQLLSSGTNRRNYRVHQAGHEYHVLFHSSHSDQAIDIHHAPSHQAAEDAIASLTAYLLNIKSNAAQSYAGERMVVVEHVLLRPYENDGKCSLQIFNHKTGLGLSSHPLPKHQREQHLELILLHGQHAKNFRIKMDRSGNRLLVLEHQEQPLATCGQSFTSDQDASAAALLLAELVRHLCENASARREHISTETPDSFYSYRVSVFFPNWPLRFQSDEFKIYAEQMVQENAPAHLAIDCYWLPVHDMRALETLYGEWKALKFSVHTEGVSGVSDTKPGQVAALDEAAQKLRLLIERLHAEQEAKAGPSHNPVSPEGQP